jgi:glycosyltransferase involved in cell wall biosynthesis
MPAGRLPIDPGQPIRVVVDGLGLVRDSAFRGIGTYCRHVIAGLAERPDMDVRVLVPRGAKLDIDVPVKRTLRIAPGRWAEAEHDALLPLDLATTGGDVFFGPGQYPPRWAPYPLVQTIHDLAPLEAEGDRPAAESRWSLRRWSRPDRMVAVSQFTASQASARLGLDASRIVVIPHGVDDGSFHPDPDLHDGPPYLLLVGEYDPRKRHALAFDVIGGLAARHPHRLLVAGRIAPWYAEAMDALVAAAPRPERIELLGHVSKQRLVELYQHADALLVTSSHEGFGLPALEGMACGVPVVAFANTATSEVVLDAGLLVPDGDVPAMQAAVERLLADHHLRDELRRNGVDRAREFTWAASVQAHADVLASAARGRREPAP